MWNLAPGWAMFPQFWFTVAERMWDVMVAD